MRKKLNSILIAMIVTVLLFTTFSSLCAAQTIELSLADSTGTEGLRGEGVTILVEEIEKHTDGKVKINVYWGESLLKSAEILDGVANGVVDMGYINANYYPNKLFLHSAFPLIPQAPISFENKNWVYSQCLNEIPEIKAEMEAQNQKLIYLNGVLPMSICSTKPITSFDDLAGQKIRSSSRWILALLKDFDAVPVSVPWGDCYMALQTGTIDGVFTNLDGIHRTKLDEPAPHIFAAKELWAATPFMYTINMDRWDSLSPEIQEGILAGCQAAVKRFGEIYEAEWDKVIAEQKEQGCTVTLASEEEIEKWVNSPSLPELQQQWIKEAEEAGADNAEEVFKKIQDIVKQGIEKDNK
jgi:TRAP-type C4-dicarboxylate transport system substrate-binding protein